MLFGLALLLTIAFSLALGIFSGYLAVSLLLKLMSVRSQPVAVAVPAETQAIAVSGD